jgi:hypothetical protein
VTLTREGLARMSPTAIAALSDAEVDAALGTTAAAEPPAPQLDREAISRMSPQQIAALDAADLDAALNS